MTAKSQMTKLLDQLMGQNRDGDNDERDLHFTDRVVCRPFLLDICINDLFINTREEMGDCTKVHSLALKDEFEKASTRRDYGYEEEVLEFLKDFIKENERKIEVAKKRIENVEDNPELEKMAQDIHELAVKIGEKVNKSEELGNEGNVDESLAVLKEVEEIKEHKKVLEDQYHNSLPRHAQQQQKLRACEVCGAFLSMYDNDRRLADHFGGKLHMGFVSIREKMTALEETIKKKRERREKEREERKKSRDHRDRDEGEDRERRRSRDRSRRSSSRDRSRRSHSRDRSRRSRSRDRSRRDSRRSRSRERRRGGGSRSNGSSRRSRSRSRDRYRSRS